MHVCAAFLHKKGHAQSIAMLIVIVAILIIVNVMGFWAKGHVQSVLEGAVDLFVPLLSSADTNDDDDWRRQTQ